MTKSTLWGSLNAEVWIISNILSFYQGRIQDFVKGGGVHPPWTKRHQGNPTLCMGRFRRESVSPKNRDGLLVATWLRVRLSPRYLQTDLCRFNPGDDHPVSVTRLSAPQQGPQDWLTRVWWWWFEFHSGTLPWWLDYLSVVRHLCLCCKRRWHT